MESGPAGLADKTADPAAWVAWRRPSRPRARWAAVGEAPTEAGARALMHAAMARPLEAGDCRHWESVVLPKGERP